ncbi:MAG: toll/interleukin-1 receptor domain-containing protein [Clostridia bacterium]|nr:toll/interleukin-1 receptor domain-containing protein [Clostridia bacterium]
MRSFTDYYTERLSVEKRLLASIKAYFQMLDIAATKDIPMETVALPLLGGGVQKISSDLTMIPIINECIEFLKRNPLVKEVYLIEYDAAKAYKFALALEKSYAVYRERSSGTYSSADGKLEDSMAFLSYSSKDRNVADNLCAKLEARGLKVWYAPRNIHSNDYASAIVDAIGKCTHFIVILSKNSMESEHVLNEIDLAFKYMKNIRFLPLRIDSEEMVPAFSYYLSRQHWMEACPPVELKLEEFVKRVMEEF